MWTLTTFAYEIDRSLMPKQFQRPFSNIVSRLCTILDFLEQTDCIVRVYCEDQQLYDKLRIEFPKAEIVLKPLHTFPIFAIRSEVQAIVDRVKQGKYPEQLSADYSLIVLSKIDAMLETAAIYPDATHMWLDGGYRWDISALSDPYWPSLSQIYVPVKRFPLQFQNKFFGGCWGGSSRALMALKQAYEEFIPVLLKEGLPFTEETLMFRIHLAHPSLFYEVHMESKGFFPVGNLERMIFFMVAGHTHYNLRHMVSVYDIAALVLVLSFVWFRIYARM
jgi:hypothetical protein